MTKNNATKTTINNTNSTNSNQGEAKMVNNHEVKFVESRSIPGAIGSVSFTPSNWNGMIWDQESSFDSISGMNAFRDFVAETYQRAGEYVHVFNPKSSRYDGMKTFYVGGSLAYNAIKEGHSTMTVQVAEKLVNLTLPSSTELIGEWVVCKMRTDFWGRVVPCEDIYHIDNLKMKHFFLNKLMTGTKLILNTTPCVVKGEMWMIGSNEAKRLQSELFDTDGSVKPVEEMLKTYQEHKAEIRQTANLDHQTAVIKKVAPIIGMTIVSVINLNDVPVNVKDVPHGKYQLVDSIGIIKNYGFKVDGSHDSEERLVTAATCGLSLRPIC